MTKVASKEGVPKKNLLRNGAVGGPGCAARLATIGLAITHTHQIALTCWRVPPGPGPACCIALAGHPENPQSFHVPQTWYAAARLKELNPDIKRNETLAKDANPHKGRSWIEVTLEPGDDPSALRADLNDPQKGDFRRDIERRCQVQGGLLRADYSGVDTTVFLERIRAKKWHKGSSWAVTFQVAFPTDQSAKEAMETLPKRKLHGFAFRTESVKASEEKPAGVYLAVDARGLPHSDTELMAALIEEGALLPQYVLSYGWNLRATDDGNVSSRGNLTLDVYLDPVIRSDHNHGSAAFETLPLSEGQVKPDVVPVRRIQQPPAAMEIQLPDSKGVVFKRFRMVGCCKYCLGPPHLRKKGQRETKCIYAGFCRICLVRFDTLPNAGRGHVCTQGVPFKKPGYDPNMPEGASPMQKPDAVARMAKLQDKIAESNRIIAAAAEAQDDNPRPRKAAKSTSMVTALVIWSLLNAQSCRIGDRVGFLTFFCLGIVSWAHRFVYRTQVFPLVLSTDCADTSDTLSRHIMTYHDIAPCGVSSCPPDRSVVGNKCDCAPPWMCSVSLTRGSDMYGAPLLICLRLRVGLCTVADLKTWSRVGVVVVNPPQGSLSTQVGLLGVQTQEARPPAGGTAHSRQALEARRCSSHRRDTIGARTKTPGSRRATRGDISHH